jgi:hypothetical protein
LISQPISASYYQNTHSHTLMGRIREEQVLISQMEQGGNCLPDPLHRILAQMTGKSAGNLGLPEGTGKPVWRQMMAKSMNLTTTTLTRAAPVWKGCTNKRIRCYGWYLIRNRSVFIFLGFPIFFTSLNFVGCVTLNFLILF